jgi:hypothetical protein
MLRAGVLDAPSLIKSVEMRQRLPASTVLGIAQCDTPPKPPARSGIRRGVDWFTIPTDRRGSVTSSLRSRSSCWTTVGGGTFTSPVINGGNDPDLALVKWTGALSLCGSMQLPWTQRRARAAPTEA